MEEKFREMKGSEIRKMKEILWERNEKKCPVLNKTIPLDKMVLDHAHKRNDEEYAPDKGVIREALEFRVNAVLGKLENALKRTGLSNEEDFDIGDFLRNAADYFERGGYQDEDGYYYVHPKEVHPEKKLKKLSYNKLKKMYDNSGKKAKFPPYPKNGRITKPLEKLYIEFDLEPGFYK